MIFWPNIFFAISIFPLSLDRGLLSSTEIILSSLSYIKLFAKIFSTGILNDLRAGHMISMNPPDMT